MIFSPHPECGVLVFLAYLHSSFFPPPPPLQHTTDTTHCTAQHIAQHSTELHSTAQHSTDSGMASQRVEFLEEYTLLDQARGKMFEMCVFHRQRNTSRIIMIFNINVKNL